MAANDFVHVIYNLSDHIGYFAVAVWQFPIQLIPKSSVASVSEFCAEEYLRSDGWWCNALWEGAITATAVRQTIDQHFIQAPSWSNELNIWGYDKGNDINLSFEEDKVEDLTVRFDMRDFDRQFADAIVEIAHSLNCFFLIMERAFLVEPTIENLVLHAEASRAKKDANLAGMSWK